MLKNLIAQDRNRTRDKNLQIDLDLTYITPNILAMAFPASGVESIWRNSISDVYRLLSNTHGANNYRIWNLAERETDAKELDFKVKWCPFPDHHPPPLSLLCEIVHSISGWLKTSLDHVAGVHCVGGKGRTGTIISSYLFYSEKFSTANAAIEYFGEKRSQKKLGVTQPSQRRYIKYFEGLVIGETINLQPIQLCSVTVGPLPVDKGFGIEVYDSPNYPEGKLLHKNYDINTGQNGEIFFPITIDMCGDLYIRFMGKTVLGKRFPYFHIVLHTYFLREKKLVFVKKELDALQRNNFSEELTVTIIFDKPKAKGVKNGLLPGLKPYITKFDADRHKRKALCQPPKEVKSNPLVHIPTIGKSNSSPNLRANLHPNTEKYILQGTKFQKQVTNANNEEQKKQLKRSLSDSSIPARKFSQKTSVRSSSTENIPRLLEPLVKKEVQQPPTPNSKKDSATEIEVVPVVTETPTKKSKIPNFSRSATLGIKSVGGRISNSMRNLTQFEKKTTDNSKSMVERSNTENPNSLKTSADLSRSDSCELPALSENYTLKIELGRSVSELDQAALDSIRNSSVEDFRNSGRESSSTNKRPLTRTSAWSNMKQNPREIQRSPLPVLDVEVLSEYALYSVQNADRSSLSEIPSIGSVTERSDNSENKGFRKTGSPEVTRKSGDFSSLAGNRKSGNFSGVSSKIQTADESGNVSNIASENTSDSLVVNVPTSPSKPKSITRAQTTKKRPSLDYSGKNRSEKSGNKTPSVSVSPPQSKHVSLDGEFPEKKRNNRKQRSEDGISEGKSPQSQKTPKKIRKVKSGFSDENLTAIAELTSSFLEEKNADGNSEEPTTTNEEDNSRKLQHSISSEFTKIFQTTPSSEDSRQMATTDDDTTTNSSTGGETNTPLEQKNVRITTFIEQDATGRQRSSSVLADQVIEISGGSTLRIHHLDAWENRPSSRNLQVQRTFLRGSRARESFTTPPSDSTLSPPKSPTTIASPEARTSKWSPASHPQSYSEEKVRRGFLREKLDKDNEVGDAVDGGEGDEKK